jgi:peroxiredoxin Q/BCP
VPLLSDADNAVGKAWGFYGEKKLYGRTFMGIIRSTFLIDPKGNLAKAWHRVKVDGHAEAVLAALRELAA